MIFCCPDRIRTCKHPIPETGVLPIELRGTARTTQPYSPSYERACHHYNDHATLIATTPTWPYGGAV
jgi:hypothetical protein